MLCRVVVFKLSFIFTVIGLNIIIVHWNSIINFLYDFPLYSLRLEILLEIKRAIDLHVISKKISLWRPRISSLNSQLINHKINKIKRILSSVWPWLRLREKLLTMSALSGSGFCQNKNIIIILIKKGFNEIQSIVHVKSWFQFPSTRMWYFTTYPNRFLYIYPKCRFKSLNSNITEVKSLKKRLNLFSGPVIRINLISEICWSSSSRNGCTPHCSL